MLLVGFENRILVLVHWTWKYITRNRSTRLIMRRYQRKLGPRSRYEPALQDHRSSELFICLLIIFTMFLNFLSLLLTSSISTVYPLS